MRKQLSDTLIEYMRGSSFLIRGCKSMIPGGSGGCSRTASSSGQQKALSPLWSSSCDTPPRRGFSYRSFIDRLSNSCSLLLYGKFGCVKSLGGTMLLRSFRVVWSSAPDWKTSNRMRLES
jgi:hypothetical protein